MSGPYEYTPYIWPMLASAALVAMLGIYGWRRRSVTGVRWFTFVDARPDPRNRRKEVMGNGPTSLVDGFSGEDTDSLSVVPSQSFLRRNKNEKP
jgi:hypothetical protein